MSFIKLDTRLPYNGKLTERTKILRKNMTEPEKKIRFGFLKGLQNTPPQGGWPMGSLRIHRQRPIHNFIVDFYIPKLRLIIEIDGESHFDEQGLVYDEERTNILKGLGLKVIRFTNNEVMNNFQGVCEMLERELKLG